MLHSLGELEDAVFRHNTTTHTTLVPDRGVPRLLPELLPLDAEIRVDFYLPGCPPNPYYVAESLTAIASGRPPEFGAHNVCFRCDRRMQKSEVSALRRRPEVDLADDVCLLSQGVLCMGSATLDRCPRALPAAGVACTGCAGPSEHVILEPNRDVRTEIADRMARMTRIPRADVVREIERRAKTYYAYAMASPVFRQKPTFFLAAGSGSLEPSHGTTIEINPVTRIEGHAKGRSSSTTPGRWRRRPCTSSSSAASSASWRDAGRADADPDHAHLRDLPACAPPGGAKTVDRGFGVTPPRAAVLLRELISCGSMIHSHAIHFFALAGPDLLLGIGAPPEQRSVVALLDLAPNVARQALELRSLGQRMVEIVGGRGTHPITCVAGGMSAGIDRAAREKLQRMAARALELARVALEVGKGALARDPDLLRALPLAVADLGTANQGRLDLYDGVLRLRRADGTRAVEFVAERYRDHLYEEALPYTYAKQTWFKDPGGSAIPYRVGPLARLNVVDSIDTPLAQAELEALRASFGDPCHETVLAPPRALVELVHHAEEGGGHPRRRRDPFAARAGEDHRGAAARRGSRGGASGGPHSRLRRGR
jgi:coenzyme F420-reducing hydrogenase gamma subunit